VIRALGDWKIGRLEDYGFADWKITDWQMENYGLPMRGLDFGSEDYAKPELAFIRFLIHDCQF
jgi:hypothetical protein